MVIKVVGLKKKKHLVECLRKMALRLSWAAC